MQDGRLETMRFHPVSLGFGTPVEERGWPVPTTASDALENLRKLSAEFGTPLEIEEDTAVWKNPVTA